LELILRKIASLKGSQAVITADHGFLFQQEPVDANDRAQFPAAQAFTFKNRRFALGSGIQASAGQKLFTAAELGLSGLVIPEAHGGLGQGPVDAMVVCEELGRGLVNAPYAFAALMSPALLSTAPAALQAAWLPGMAGGETLVVPALQERAARYRLNHVTTTAREHGGALRASDLAVFEPEWVEPIAQNYRGYTVHELPPNGQGIAALMALGMLEHFDLAALPVDGAACQHLQIEAIKLAFADVYRQVAEPSAMHHGQTESRRDARA
jgi:hypothetical protein